MKIFKRIGVLLVTLGAFSASPQPSVYQYHFDNDRSFNQMNIHEYDGNTNELTINADELQEIGEALNYHRTNAIKPGSNYSNSEVFQGGINTIMSFTDKVIQVTGSGPSTLSAPLITYDDDGVLEITHNDREAELVVTVNPIQEYEKVASNHIRFIPQYGTNVSAYATRKNYYDSSTIEMTAVAKPVIKVTEYEVEIEGEGNIYYTIDGTIPTKKSSPYSGKPFKTVACTIKAAAFNDGYIPSEVATDTVMDATAIPKLNFVNGYLKLSCSTPNAIIYYSLNQHISDKYRTVYDEKTMPNGIDLNNVSTIWIYAEAKGYRRSETKDYEISDYSLDAPNLSYESGLDGKGFVVATHSDCDALIKFTDANGQSLEAVSNSPCKVMVDYNSEVQAYAYKNGFLNSKVVSIGHTVPPTISLDSYTVSINYNKEKQSVYYTVDGTTPAPGLNTSTKYVNPFNAMPNSIVKAVAFENDGSLIPAIADSVKVIEQTAKPKMEFNFCRKDVDGVKTEVRKMKFISDTQGAQIYYSFELAPTESTKRLYDPTSEPEGADVSGASVVYAYAESEGKRRSDVDSWNTSDGYLTQPSVRVNDGVVEITHNDPSVTIVPEFSPAQEFEYVHDGTTNKVICKVEYNTSVRACVEKTGYIESDPVVENPLPKPVIEVDGFNVRISNINGKAFYTTDGSCPTKGSNPYNDGDFFKVEPCTVRAACFSDGKIPAEADSVKVLGQTASPKMEFNFSRMTIDGVVTDIKKMKFSSITPDACIFYSFDAPPTDSTRNLYDPTKEPDGADVSGASSVHAYAESDGMRRSEVVYVNTSDGYLSKPDILVNDTIVEISHKDLSVDIVLDFNPKESEYVHDGVTNKVICKVEYNTVVKAHVEKAGYIESDPVSRNPISKPFINVNGFNVEILFDDEDGKVDVFYTIDNSLPTKKSAKYTKPFETTPSTIRAVAFKDGEIPAEADKKKVMAQAAKPEIDFNGRYAFLSSATPGAVIYYSLNQDIADANRIKYEDNGVGIDISDVVSIYAYAEAENYRRSENLEYSISANTLKAPELKYENGYVVATHDDPDVTIRFSGKDGSDLTPEPQSLRRVAVQYNSEVSANSYKKGYVDSEKVQIGFTNPPVISEKGFTVTIKYNENTQTVYYTTNGDIPTTESTLYVNPFRIYDAVDCRINAVAFENDGSRIPGLAETKTIEYQKCVTPQFYSYDGRNIVFSAEEDAMLRYVIIDVEGKVISEGIASPGSKIDMEGLNTIKVVAIRTGYDDSEELSYPSKGYYANETDAYTSRPGVLKDAFGWCDDDLSRFDSLKVHGSLNAGSAEDSGDYAFLCSIPALRHIDLSDVTDTMVPDSAFAASRLISVTLPSTMKNAGKGIFGKRNITLCAVQFPADEFAPAHLLDGVTNSNLLLYAKNKNRVSDLISYTGGVISNVVVYGGINGTDRADEVRLSHALPFYAPSEFTASKISFTRNFSKETQIGSDQLGSGWETLVLPFDVQNMTCAKRSFKPFGEAKIDNGDHPFWLFKAAETDWDKETTMVANVPYLLAFPNHPYYADEFCVNGDVVFSSTNVTVTKTPDEQDMKFDFGVGRSIVGSFRFIEKNEAKLAVNEVQVSYENHNYQPGGLFISGLKDIPPFECYVVSQGAKAVPVFDRTQIDELMDNYSTRIWGESYAICIRSAIAMKLRIFDMVGQLIRIVDVPAGETVRTEGLTPGIYFVGNSKILVKG